MLPICHLVLLCQRPPPEGYPKAPNSLGEHLRKRRMDLGLYQRDVASKIGATACSVWNWEAGLNEPENRFLPAILAFLGYDPRPAGLTLGERLVALRKGKGWSQKTAAGALGVDPTTLARWERNEQAPWGPYVKLVADFLSD